MQYFSIFRNSPFSALLLNSLKASWAFSRKAALSDRISNGINIDFQLQFWEIFETDLKAFYHAAAGISDTHRYRGKVACDGASA